MNISFLTVYLYVKMSKFLLTNDKQITYITTITDYTIYIYG
jgi:hypothetical protein